MSVKTERAKFRVSKCVKRLRDSLAFGAPETHPFFFARLEEDIAAILDEVEAEIEKEYGA